MGETGIRPPVPTRERLLSRFSSILMGLFFPGVATLVRPQHRELAVRHKKQIQSQHAGKAEIRSDNIRSGRH